MAQRHSISMIASILGKPRSAITRVIKTNDLKIHNNAIRDISLPTNRSSETAGFVLNKYHSKVTREML